MHVVHLTASSFFGGPERQILGLGTALPYPFRTTILTFSEDGRCRAFLREAQAVGLAAVELAGDFPKVRAAVREVARFLDEERADVLVTHGYKSNLLGRPAARRAGIPIVSVARGWTGENFKVRCYEALDRAHLRFMDRVVCVSEGQAAKVRRAGVRGERIRVIHNGARLAAFKSPDPSARTRLRKLAGGEGPILLAAGRLSPEKGFRVLVEAAARVVVSNPGVRFVLFGDGSERPPLERRVGELGLSDRFALPGFRSDLDDLIPWSDVVVLPSFTEGLPNVALEAGAAGVPVVATAVGGTPEVVADGRTGFLVPPGRPDELAQKIIDLVGDPALARCLGAAGRKRMEDHFSFPAQARGYMELFEEVVAACPSRPSVLAAACP